MSTTLKIAYLRMLHRFGKKSLISKSAFGHPYRISLGDMFSENPFYNSSSNLGEILATVAWVLDKPNAVICDIGAHCGFISSQVAQLLRHNKPAIYAFEPVGPTFSDLINTVIDLKLQEFVHPVSVALSDSSGFVRLNYSKVNSMLAQIVGSDQYSNERSGKEIYLAPAQTLDLFCTTVRCPDVIKIDVEGWEVHVFQGAKEFLNSGIQTTGICLEWNPEALEQAGSKAAEFYELLKEYRFFYINDYEGQRFSELQEIQDPRELLHCCNLFASRDTVSRIENWKENFRKLKLLVRDGGH